MRDFPYNSALLGLVSYHDLCLMLESPFFSERLPVQLDYFGMFYPSNSILYFEPYAENTAKTYSVLGTSIYNSFKMCLYQMELGLING